MEIYKYTFKCEKIANKMTLHALATNVFNKENAHKENFKIYKEGKLIKLITDKNLDLTNFRIKLFNQKGVQFNCFFVNKENIRLKKYQNGEKKIISGIIEYGVNLTNQKGKKCPFFMGRFENNQLKNIFKKNIEEKMGVQVLSMSREFFSRQQSEFISKHIQFNNIIELNIPIKIVDEIKFNKLQYQSVFQKKTYGFGNIEIIQ